MHDFIDKIEDYKELIISLSGLVTTWGLFRKKIARYWKHTFLYRAYKTIDRIEHIDQELYNNGGSSHKDKLDAVYEKVHVIYDKVHNIEVRNKFFLDRENFGYFECDLEGNNTYVNKKYATILKCSREDLMNKGWVNYIHPDYVESYANVWESAMKDERVFMYEMICVNTEKKEISVKVDAAPIYKLGKLSGYVGIIYFEND